MSVMVKCGLDETYRINDKAITRKFIYMALFIHPANYQNIYHCRILSAVRLILFIDVLLNTIALALEFFEKRHLKSQKMTNP